MWWRGARAHEDRLAIGARPVRRRVEPAGELRAGRPGRHVRRLGPTPTVPLFAHVSRNKSGSCAVFLDTPSTVDDRRYLQARGRFSQVCAGDCGQDVEPGARTFQFLRDGTLPPL